MWLHAVLVNASSGKEKARVAVARASRNARIISALLSRHEARSSARRFTGPAGTTSEGLSVNSFMPGLRSSSRSLLGSLRKTYWGAIVWKQRRQIWPFCCVEKSRLREQKLSISSEEFERVPDRCPIAVAPIDAFDHSIFGASPTGLARAASLGEPRIDCIGAFL